MPFEWDEAKADSNVRKHGVTFEEASTVFADGLSQTAYDPDHSLEEHRYVTIGMAGTGRVLVVCHTDRSGVDRIISARPATRNERKRYEDGD